MLAVRARNLFSPDVQRSDRPRFATTTTMPKDQPDEIAPIVPLLPSTNSRTRPNEGPRPGRTMTPFRPIEADVSPADRPHQRIEPLVPDL
jgi:hypothetical protein